MADKIACQAQFGWMNNSMQQTPCLVAAWLISICQDPTGPAGVGPLSNTGSPYYLPPNGTSATTCTCSWAFYNTLMACTVCQGFDLQPSVDAWSAWSSSCGLLGKLSSVLYWPSDQSLVGRTALPRWSILNATSWDGQIFNVKQAQAIANQSLPDVTDSTAPQPTLSSKPSPPSTAGTSHSSPPAGAIAGGVAGGVFVLGLGALLLWYLCYYRKKVRHAHQWRQRAHVDLNAEEGEKPLESPPVSAAFSSGMGMGMGMYAGNANVNATPYDPYAPLQMQMQQGYAHAATYTGAPGPAPTSAQNLPPSPPAGTQPPATIQAIQTYPLSGGGGRSRIPTVADQLSEKQRLREERARGGRGAGSSRPSVASASASASASSRSTTLPPGAFPGAVDEAGVLMYAGHHNHNHHHHHLRGSSSVSALSAGSTSYFHSQSQSQTQSQSHSASDSQSGSMAHLPGKALRTSSLDSNVDGQKQQQGQGQGQAARRPSRRLSLAKAPWNRRRPAVSEPASSVVGDAADVGGAQEQQLHDVALDDSHNDASHASHDADDVRAQSPLPLPIPIPTSPSSASARLSVAAVEHVLATVPGARMPSARDREQPPPSYVSSVPAAASGVSLFSSASAGEPGLGGGGG